MMKGYEVADSFPQSGSSIRSSLNATIKALGQPVALHEVADRRGVIGAIGRWKHGSAAFTREQTDCFQVILNVSGGHVVEHRDRSGIRTAVAAAGAVGILAPGKNSALRITGDADIVQVFLSPDVVVDAGNRRGHRFDDHYRAVSLTLNASVTTAVIALTTGKKASEQLMRRVIADAAKGIITCSSSRAHFAGGLSPFARNRAHALIDNWLEHGEGPPPTIADMAQVAGRSPWHFMRAYRVAEGTTPGKAVLTRRIDRVIGLLLTSTRPLSEIAEETGFCSASHLVAVFRGALGVTPGALRLAATSCAP